MSLTERSRRRVADALDRLESEYGGFEVDEKTWNHPPDAYEAIRQRFEAGTLGGAGCWTTDDEGRVLLVRHEGEKEGKDGTSWSDPGGKQEPSETLEEAARRETREEAGVEVEIRGVQQARRIEIRDKSGERPPEEAGARSVDENGSSPPIHRLIVVFDAVYVSGEPRPREGEIAEVRWWSEHPDDLLYPELGEFSIPAAE